MQDCNFSYRFNAHYDLSRIFLKWLQILKFIIYFINKGDTLYFSMRTGSDPANINTGIVISKTSFVTQLELILWWKIVCNTMIYMIFQYN